MTTPKQKAVLYIDRNRIDLAVQGSDSICSCNITNNLVQDLELQNEVELEKLITTFITQNKISPSYFVTVLSHNVLFEKDIVNLTGSQAESVHFEFVGNVPFENTISKMYKTANGFRTVVMNNDYYLSVKTALIKLGFIADAVIPDFILGQEIAQKSSLDLSTVKFVLQKFDSLRQQSLISQENTVQKNVEQSPVLQNNDPKKSQLPLLLGVFGILIIILIIVVLMQPSNNPVKKTPSLPAQVIQPTITPIASASATPAIIISPASISTQSAVNQ